MRHDDNPAVKSLDRGLNILEYLAVVDPPPSFSQLLTDLGIPRSSLCNLLNNLQARDFIGRDPETDGYLLGSSFRRLARKAPQPPLRDRVLPFLQQLSRDLNETCGFYVRVEDAVEVIASAISTQALSCTMKIGARAPLYAVSAGKIVLAELEPAALNEYLGHVVLVPATPQTVRSKAHLRQEIQQVKTAGFAYSHQEFTPGITAIAIAVRRGGTFVGAINVAVPSVRFTPTRDTEYCEALRITAQAIAGALD